MKCNICKYNKIGKYGHNAEPVNSGRCCDWCNANVVLPTRIRNMNKSERVKI